MSHIDLSKVKGARKIMAVVTATAMGAGFFPKFPASMGTLFAAPLAFIAIDWTWPIKLLLWGGLTIAGTWAAKVIDEIMDSNDNKSIVIDEVVGFGITAWVVSPTWQSLLAAFVLFRFLDIVKIPPVRQLDHWSKKKAAQGTTSAKWWGAFGVMADDILAGLQGLMIMVLLSYLKILP